MEKVYVVMDQDLELISLAVDLASVKAIITDEFNDSAIDMRIEKTNTGYQITVKDEGIRYKYNAYYMPIKGVN